MMNVSKLNLHVVLLTFFLSVTFVLFTNIGFGQNTIEYKGKELEEITPRVQYFADSTGKLDFTTISAPHYQKQFKNIPKVTLSQPTTPKVLWFKFTLKNQARDHLWLVLNSFAAKQVDLFVLDSTLTKVSRQTIDDFKVAPRRRKRSYSVLLTDKNEKERKTYYLKIREGTAKNYTLSVGSTMAVNHFFMYIDFIVAGFFGIILCAFVYNLFMLLSTFEKLYLIYLAYLVVGVILIPFAVGQPLFESTWMRKHIFAWHSVIYIFSTLFVVYYLDLKQTAPKLYKFIKFLTYFLVLGNFILDLSGILRALNLYFYSLLLIIVYYVTLLVCGVYLSRRYRRARCAVKQSYCNSINNQVCCNKDGGRPTKGDFTGVAFKPPYGAFSVMKRY